jgi:adenylyl cyclase-associated protein
MSADQILSRLEQIVSRLEAVEAKIGDGPGGAAPAAPAEQGAAAKAWEDLVAGYFVPFKATTDKIGGDNVKAQMNLIATGNAEISKLINIASQSKQPAVADLQKIIAPIAAVIKGVKELRESNRRDKQWEHLSTLSEAIAYMNWVVVTPTPAPFVKESLDASLFWSNKILKEHKGKNEDQVAFCNQLKEFLGEMQKYIKQHHTTGLTWNAKGGDAAAASSSSSSSSSAPPPPAAGPPPPGPPPPAASAPAPSKGGDPNALFAQLNQGGAITSGLKKVTRDMQTHKNPNLRAGGTVKTVEKKGAAPKKFAAATKAKPPPKGPVLEGNKWVIEFHEGNNALTLPAEEIEPKHSVYIYKCEKCTINIPSKVNGVIMDSGKRCGVVFQDVISGCEIVNSQSINVQSCGKIPNFAIDKASSVQIILSEASIDAQIVTSKCDSVNIMFPKDGDHTELPVPEQFVTTIKGGKLNTTTLEHE